jgi:peptide/nickel transport system permease protein
VTTLRAARIPERRILWRHVVRGAALPALTLLSVNTAYLIGGTLVVEKVFGIGGLGTLLFQSIGSRDFPVVQGVALYCAVLVVIVTTLAGVLAAALDPRLRVGDEPVASDPRRPLSPDSALGSPALRSAESTPSAPATVRDRQARRAGGGSAR